MIVLTNNNYIEVTCSKCNSELGVHIEDIHDNDVSGETSCLCGACGAKVIIPLGLIPASWRAQIFDD